MVRINNYSAKKIAKLLGNSLSTPDFSIDFITTNSKDTTKNNSCFFAIRGERFDGHNFCQEAIKNGAKLIVADHEINVNVPVIYVDNTVMALGVLAKNNIGKTKVIAVTGSVGKTTTKDMIFAVLNERYKVIATEANLNNEIGVPLTLLRLNGEDFAVVEMGMRGLGEIDYLSSISRPETSIITNAFTSHIERLKTKENIFIAKKEILNYAPKYAILPSEKRFKNLDLQGISPFFIGDEGDVNINDFKYTNNGITFSINHNNKIVNSYNLNTFSKHNLTNALFAYIVGKIYNLSDSEIREGLRKYKNSKMREEYLVINGITVINDCYNASLESVKSSIESLSVYSNIKNKKKNVLLGDILEAGDNADEFHFEIGKACKEFGVEKLFTYGKYGKITLSGFGGGIQFEKKSEISRYLKKALTEDDALLIKGSRGVHLEEIIEEMKENKNG